VPRRQPKPTHILARIDLEQPARGLLLKPLARVPLVHTGHIRKTHG
jgi:hypothetical protein